MKIIRLVAVAFIALAPFGAFAQTSTPATSSTCGNPGQPACVGSPAPAATQNTITTTGPVSSTTKIETGTLAGEVLTWVAATFGSSIGLAVTALLLRLLKNAGFAGNEILRQRLQDMIVNGLNAGAAAAADKLKDKGQIEVKNEVVAKAVDYVQAHGADTLKQLGIDPASSSAVEAIKARIETAINDPATPTPPALDPVDAPKAA